MKIAAPFATEKSSPSPGKKLLSSSPSSTAALSLLEAGTQLKAKVIEIASNGMLQVETTAGKLSAKSLVPLEIGREFWFEVVKGGDNPLLSAAVNKNSVGEILRLLSAGLKMPADNLTADVAALQDPAVRIPKETKLAVNELLRSVVSQAEPEPEKVLRLLSLLRQPLDHQPSLVKGQPVVAGKSMSLLGDALEQGAVAAQKAVDNDQPEKAKTIAIKELVRALDTLAIPRPVRYQAQNSGAAQASTVVPDEKRALGSQGRAQSPVINNGDFFKAVVRDNALEKIFTVETKGRSIDVYSPSELVLGKESWFMATHAGTGTSTPVSVLPVVEQDIILELARVMRPLMNVANISPLASTKLQAILFPAEGFAKSNELGLQQLFDVMAQDRPEPEKIIRSLTEVGFLGFSEKESANRQVQNFLRSDFDKLVELVAIIQQEDEGLINHNLASGSLKKTARLVEAHYQYNTHPVTDQSSVSLLFPCFFTGGAGGGEWMFSFARDDEKGGEGLENYQLSFYLNMSSLGDVFLQMSKHEHGVKGVFSLSTDKAVAHVRDNLEHLSTALQNIYEHVTLTCRKSSCSAIGQLKDDLAAQSSNSSFLLVDVTA